MQPVAPTKEERRAIKKLTKEGCSAFENYKMVVVHRRKLKNAPYNPRKISGEAKKRLKKNLVKVGLVAPLTWNRRTGNLVGGHQRIAVLDALEGSEDYSLRVAAVDMDEETEMEQNIFLNNTNAQGDFDFEKLGEMFKMGADFEASGFDMGEIHALFGSNPAIAKPEDLEKLSARMKKIEDVRENIDELRKSKGNGIGNRTDVNFYTVVVFRDDPTREKFYAALGLPDNRYVDGRRLWALIAEKNEAVEMPEDGTPSVDKLLKKRSKGKITFRKKEDDDVQPVASKRSRKSDPDDEDDD